MHQLRSVQKWCKNGATLQRARPKVGTNRAKKGQFVPNRAKPQDGLAPKVRTGGVALEEAVMKEIKRRRHHSREYRRKAVELLLTGKTTSELARDLGVSKTALCKWKDEYLLEMAQEPGDVKGLSAMELAQRYEQLLKAHEKLKRQQEILKKALGIFSETLPTDMP